MLFVYFFIHTILSHLSHTKHQSIEYSYEKENNTNLVIIMPQFNTQKSIAKEIAKEQKG